MGCEGESLESGGSRKPKALPTALAFADFSAKPRETFLLARGDFRAKSEPVELGFLTALTRAKTPAEYWAAARAGSRRPDSTQQRPRDGRMDDGHGARRGRAGRACHRKSRLAASLRRKGWCGP